MNSEKNSSSKNFYIIIKKQIDNFEAKSENFTNEESKAYEYLNECYFKIKETLTRCGNNISEIDSKQEVINIFNSFISWNNPNKIE